ncbi:MAG TPA: hypothetical protein VIQ77_14070 [Mucilaginibacter sp.]|jgi:hypothetical protein
MNNGNLYVQAYYQGGMTGFEVLCSDDIYQVARDGRIIATLRHDTQWHQLSGDPLPDDVIESIGMQIEKPESQA